jgi:hypothetical protein
MLAHASARPETKSHRLGTLPRHLGHYEEQLAAAVMAGLARGRRTGLAE